MFRWLRVEPLLLLLLMWLIFIFDLILPINITELGIRPRHLLAIPGVMAAPFLHGNFGHIMANTIPFFILASLLRLQGQKVFWLVTLFIGIISGLVVWCFSTADLVVGASAVVFGYWGYLLGYALFKRSLLSILVALVVLFFYGGMYLSFFEFRVGVSWLGHFSGAVAGVVAARYLAQISNVN